MIFFFFFFDGAIHRQDRLFTFFSNGQGLRFVGRKEQKVIFSILPNFITFSMVI